MDIYTFLYTNSLGGNFIADQFSAGLSLLGGNFQFKHALLALLQAAREGDAEAFIERLDDIEIKKEDDHFEMIQVKLRTGGNELTDMSSDLWTTLRVWSTAITEKKISLDKTTFALVTAQKPAEGNGVSELYADPKTKNIEHLSECLKNAARISTNKETEKAREAFLSLSEIQRKALLSKIRVINNVPDIKEVEEKISQILRHSTRPQHLDALLRRLYGWWYETVSQHLYEKSHDAITSQSVDAQIILLQEQFVEDNLPIDFLEKDPTPEGALSDDQRTFVKQLEEIAVSNARIHFAISDYYKASFQRSEWIRDDPIIAEEIKRYEKRLIEEWARHLEELKEELSALSTEDDKKTVGKKLYNWMHNDADIRIRDKVTTSYVIRGNYHILSDQKRVWWHPEFVERLQKLLTPKGGVSSE